MAISRTPREVTVHRSAAQNANDAARVASEAVGVAENTNRTVSKLGESSAEIGNVIKVITSIAGRSPRRSPAWRTPPRPTTATLAEADQTASELANLTGELQAAVGRFRI